MHHDKNDIHYWTYGNEKNQSLLLIHGFTGSHEGFRYVTPELAKKFYIIAPDLPGFGISPLDFSPWTIDTLAARTNQFVKAMKFKKKPIVVSHSMGGLVAASMLAQAPALYAERTVFISPVATKVKFFDSRKIGAVFGALHFSAGKHTGKVGDRLVRSKHISRVATSTIMTTKDTALRAKINDHHFKNLNYISSIDYYHQLHRDINRRGVIDYASALHKLDILIISGGKDNVTPLKGVRFLATSIGANLEVMPNVGHLSHYETPKAITTPLLRFLE